jgi:transposase
VPLDDGASGTAHAQILAERAARVEAEAKLVEACAEVANARADLSSTEALISRLKLEIGAACFTALAQNKRRGSWTRWSFETAATEDELEAEKAAARTQTMQSFQRKRPSRKPFPDHLPRERVAIPAPANCPCCGSPKLSKLGEDITETLEVIPRQWKVIQTVRGKFSCRDCETITQPPAPFHVTHAALLVPICW